MSILSGHEIRRQVDTGGIEIDPYDETRVQPNSIDLTLGAEVCVYSSVSAMGDPKYAGLNGIELGTSLAVSRCIHSCGGILDPREKSPHIVMRMDESGWLLVPGVLYLMHTAERIHTKKYVTQLNGKSSIARLGVIVHFTAAYGETGFNGQYTLEVSAVHPTILYPGMAIAQAVFYTVEGEVEDYQTKGHYTGSGARGAIPSRSHEQFKERE